MTARRVARSGGWGASLHDTVRPGVKLFWLAFPLLMFVLVFAYAPLFGWIYAFFDYKVGMRLSHTPFVGLKYFQMIFSSRFAINAIVRVMRNTFAMSLLNIVGSVLPAIFAILLNELPYKRYRHTVQTFVTLPNFISWVMIYSVVWAMFSVNDGFVNRLLILIGATDSGINFLASKEHVWGTQWLYGLWKGLGWNMIIYLSAIAGLDQEPYEAARIDGASRFGIIRHIVIPGLMPTFFVLLLLAIANFINNGMEQFYVFQNPMNKASIEVLDLYVYNQGIASDQIPYATAIGMLKSIMSICLLFMANGLSKLARGESIL